MSDICTNTKRFASAVGFSGASNNDLLRIAAQAIEYAGEVSGSDMWDVESIPVAYCVYGAWYREERRKVSRDTQVARVIRSMRADGLEIDADDDSFRFEYDGMTFEIMTEDSHEARRIDAIECMAEDAEYEVERMKDEIGGGFSYYVTFDRAAFERDAEHDVDSWISPYDGCVHDMTWAEYGAGRTCCGYANDANPDIVIRRESLYMIRED